MSAKNRFMISLDFDLRSKLGVAGFNNGNSLNEEIVIRLERTFSEDRERERAKKEDRDRAKQLRTDPSPEELHALSLWAQATVAPQDGWPESITAEQIRRLNMANAARWNDGTG